MRVADGSHRRKKMPVASRFDSIATTAGQYTRRARPSVRGPGLRPRRILTGGRDPLHRFVERNCGVPKSFDVLRLAHDCARYVLGLRCGGSSAMIKSELVERIALQNPNLYRRDVEYLVDAILGTIGEALCRGDRVELRGFGVFSVRKRGARPGRNPRSGAVVPVAPKSFPFFKTGKEMNQRLNRPQVADGNAKPDGR
jgi:integration host factor subunit beta